jgi:spore germination cell wall hydrolase CwlJ-like protein
MAVVMLNSLVKNPTTAMIAAPHAARRIAERQNPSSLNRLSLSAMEMNATTVANGTQGSERSNAPPAAVPNSLKDKLTFGMSIKAMVDNVRQPKAVATSVGVM